MAERQPKAEHGPNCPCTRCRGFEPGNEVSTRHGAYATVNLGPRVDELADLIRPTVPTYRSGDEVMLRVLCLALTRLERSADAQGEMKDATELHRLRQDERGWANTVRRYLDDLGLSPMARARLKLDVAMTSRALTLTGLAEQAELEAEAIEDDGAKGGS
jgi:hypothetical protein